MLSNKLHETLSFDMKNASCLLVSKIYALDNCGVFEQSVKLMKWKADNI